MSLGRRIAPILAITAAIACLFSSTALADPPDCDPGVSCTGGNNCTRASVNPLCGGSAEIMGTTYSFGSDCYHAISPGIHLLGSPSGLAFNNGGGLRVKLFKPGGSRLPGDREVWLQVQEGQQPDLLDSGPTPLECGNGHGVVTYYLEGEETGDTSAVILYPSFGGSGEAGIAIEICCQPYYCPILPDVFDCRSTDIDDDGDTDEADEALMRTTMAGSYSATRDLNWDSSVNQTDLDILMLEARRRVRGTGCELSLGTFTQTRPAGISNLSATRTGTSVYLRWTATGDDSLTGTAFQYDVRSSGSPITDDASFNSANSVSGAPAPAASGTVQSFTATIATADTFVAIKVMDDAGNWSKLNYVPPVTDLTAGTGKTTAVLGWTAPGDNGIAGTARRYDLRRSTSAINEGNFSGATNVGTCGPQEGGADECLQATGLQSCTTYYWTVKAQGANGNWSAISNVPSAATKCTGNLVVQCDGFAAGQASDEDDVAKLDFALASINARQGTLSFSYQCPYSLAGQSLSITLLDVAGRRITATDDVPAVAGRHGVSLRTSDRTIPAGVYFARLRLGDQTLMRTISVNR